MMVQLVKRRLASEERSREPGQPPPLSASIVVTPSVGSTSAGHAGGADTATTTDGGHVECMSKKQMKRLGRRFMRHHRHRPKVYPSTYTVDSPFIFEGTPLERDTTDQSVVKKAQQAGFDRLGFANKLGMHRSLFYHSPYLCCLHCNAIVFIDVSRVRTSLHRNLLPTDVDPPMEVLPTCIGCGRTDRYIVGAEDLDELIKQGATDVSLRLRRERAAARVIQEAYRRSLHHRHGRAQRQAVKMWTKLQHRMAAIIQSMYRMRLAVRRRNIEKDLLVIKHAHLAIFQWCMTKANENCTIRCFWYPSQGMVKQLYADYWVLLERTGYRPRRNVVEDNVHELARRVRTRQLWYITKIQKVWRGILTRRYIRVYARELTWLREMEATSAFKIQRHFRGWRDRRWAWAEQEKRKKEQLKRETAARVEATRDGKRMKDLKAELMAAYVRERAVEVTARRRGQTDLKAANGKKMKAFAESMYGGSEVNERMQDCLDVLRDMKHKFVAQEQAQAEHVAWIRKRQGDDKYLKLYYAQEIKSNKRATIQKLMAQVGYQKSLANRVIKESTTSGKTYVYPKGINSNKRHILDVDIENLCDNDVFEETAQQSSES